MDIDIQSILEFSRARGKILDASGKPVPQKNEENNLTVEVICRQQKNGVFLENERQIIIDLQKRLLDGVTTLQADDVAMLTDSLKAHIMIVEQYEELF